MSETPRNPYRAAGTFNGEVYIEREADERLLKEIRNNDSFPYFCAPRQSGKSSLIAHTISRLDDSQLNPGCKAIQVDLSSFEVDYQTSSLQVDTNPRFFIAYEEFLRKLVLIISKNLGITDFELNQTQLDDPSVLEDLLVSWQKQIQKRLVIFLDEIDTLQDAPFKETFLNKLRSIFNARELRGGEAYKQIQFVLSGSLHPTVLIPNPLKSPFNVGKEIELADFTKTEVTMLADPLRTLGPIQFDRIVDIIYAHTSGNLYLCQTILKIVWERTREKDGMISLKDVRKIIKEIIANSHQDIHFLNIYNSFQGKSQANLSKSLQRYYSTGRPPREEELRGLITTGLCDRQRAFRCQIYFQVFGPRGHHLTLVHSNRRTFILWTVIVLLCFLVGYRATRESHYAFSDWMNFLRGLAAFLTNDHSSFRNDLGARDKRLDMRPAEDLAPANPQDMARFDLQHRSAGPSASYPPLRFAEPHISEPDPTLDCVIPSPSFISGMTEEVFDAGGFSQKSLRPLSDAQKRAIFQVIQGYKFCGTESVELKDNDHQLIIDSEQPIPQSMRSASIRIEIAEQLHNEFMKSAIKLPKTVHIQK